MMSMSIYRDHSGQLHDPWRHPELCGSTTCAICGWGKKGELWAERYGDIVDLVPEKK